MKKINKFEKINAHSKKRETGKSSGTNTTFIKENHLQNYSDPDIIEKYYDAISDDNENVNFKAKVLSDAKRVIPRQNQLKNNINKNLKK